MKIWKGWDGTNCMAWNSRNETNFMTWNILAGTNLWSEMAKMEHFLWPEMIGMKKSLQLKASDTEKIDNLKHGQDETKITTWIEKKLQPMYQQL